jgi:hypothetical protein
VLASGGSTAGHLLSRVVYDPGSLATYSTTSTSFADVDLPNLTLPDFVHPASGEVEVEVAAYGVAGAGTVLALNVRDGSGNIAGSDARYLQATIARVVWRIRISGLTPGAAATAWRLGFARTSGSSSAQLFAGPTAGGDVGPIIIKVIAI